MANNADMVRFTIDNSRFLDSSGQLDRGTLKDWEAQVKAFTKALLSAIPKPDPLSEKSRVRQVYNPATSHDYFTQKPTFREILPGHFVLCNDAEEAKYKEEIAKLDKEAK